MNSRVSYSFRMDIKFKNWKRLSRHLFMLIFYPFANKWERKMIFEDNIRVPFNRKFGCKWFNHRWKYIREDDIYFCKDCSTLLKSEEFVSEKREKTLKDLGVK